MNDELILVDLFDNEIGYETKRETHIKGLLHRAFSVFIVNGNKTLIQRRALDKYHSGGLWANACCSHPRRGEKLDEAVRRRMIEELGIECFVEEKFSFVYFSKYDNNLHEYEFDHVFIGEYDGNIDINKAEIDEVKWIKIDELKIDIVKEPQKYATWFIIAFAEVVRRLENGMVFSAPIL